MPGGDGTGPVGQGPMTGRALGYCAGYSTPGYTKGLRGGMGRGWWRGRGFGFGRGIGWGRGFYRGRNFRGTLYNPPIGISPVYNPYGLGVSPTTTPENQLAMLKQEKDYLNSEMESIKNAIDDISKKIEELENEK
ncbi:MAG: DUF5320 domain-containing protein [Promethearchaeota archaeon]